MATVDISESLQRGIDDLIGFLPRLLGFLLIVLIDLLVAKLLQKVVRLAREAWHRQGAARGVEWPVREPARA